MLRTAIIMDYQNVHLTAHDIFDPNGEQHDSLISPAAFAAITIRVRNNKVRPGYEWAELSRVEVFRGLPHSDYDWEQNRRCTDQARQWRADGALVELRDLKYKFKRDAEGNPLFDADGRKIPFGRPEEKGIDVLCALASIRASEDPNIDLVILATRDTDLIPVLDELYDRRGRDSRRYAAIETVAWFSPLARREKRYAGGNLRPTAPRKIWNTNLDENDYAVAVDSRSYS